MRFLGAMTIICSALSGFLLLAYYVDAWLRPELLVYVRIRGRWRVVAHEDVRYISAEDSPQKSEQKNISPPYSTEE